MNIKTRQALERFFGMSTWSKWGENDNDVFIDFIVESFKNKDYVISLSEMKKIAKEKEEKELTSDQIDQIDECDGKFKDGISLLKKYLSR